MISIALMPSVPTASERVIPPLPEPLPEGGQRGCQRRHLVRRASHTYETGELAVFTTRRCDRKLTAAEALEAVRSFNERYAPLHLGVRFGLHTGRVFVGHAGGGGGQFIYGIVGDIANTASRIEQLNKQLGTRLLGTEEVVADLDKRAIEAFRGERWEEAESYFQGILRDYPDDGPARFYLGERLPEVRQMAPPVSGSPAVIGGEAVQ